mgnify:CR=1 FL=1
MRPDSPTPDPPKRLTGDSANCPISVSTPRPLDPTDTRSNGRNDICALVPTALFGLTPPLISTVYVDLVILTEVRERHSLAGPSVLETSTRSKSGLF